MAGDCTRYAREEIPKVVQKKHILCKNTNSTTQRMTTASRKISAVKIPSHLSRNRQKFNEGETLINRLRYEVLFLSFSLLSFFLSLGRDMECNDESRNVRKYTP